MAHWRAEFDADKEGASLDLRVAGHQQTLPPGATILTPYAFTGLFAGDLDEMGQELLEWQYRYLWEDTREPWFPGCPSGGRRASLAVPLHASERVLGALVVHLPPGVEPAYDGLTIEVEPHG